jgi:arylsulfatase
MPTPRQLLRLLLVAVLPFVAVALLGAVIHGLREGAANGWGDLGLGALTASRVRAQVLLELAWIGTAGIACLLAFLVLLRIGRPAAYLATLPWAGLVCLLAARLWYPAEWSTRTVRNDLALPSLFSNYELLGGLKIAALVLGIAALLVTVLLWRRGADPATLWRSPGLARIGRLAAATCGLLLAGSLLSGWIAAPDAARGGLNVIYITWDSTRADHLSCYGYPRPTSPHLDALAADGVRYRTAISQHNWTRPSYASIFTGVPSWMLSGGFDRWALTLAELLKGNGYRTVGYVQNPNLDAELHFDQGFDRFTHLHPLSGPQAVNRLVLDEVRGLAASDRPFFLFVHYQGPHWPYDRDNPFLAEFVDPNATPVKPETVAFLMKQNGRGWTPDRRSAEGTAASMLELYDAAIRLTDEATGELLDLLRETGLYENSLIVFNSDHGDEFLDHGAFGHAHKNLHPELTYVPLVLRHPAGAPAVVERPAQSLDILPTVLAATGIEPPFPLPGLALLEQGRAVELPTRLAYSNRGGVVAVRDGSHALVMDYEDGALVGLYDSRQDPAELTALPDAEQDPAWAGLRPHADDWHRDWRTTQEDGQGATEMSEELLERLRGLGYVD